MDLARSLTSHPALAALPARDLDALAFAFVECRARPNELLTELGKPGAAMYVILEGEVSVTVPGPDGDIELRRLGPGSWLGLLALIDGAPASATCRAVGSPRLAVLRRTAFGFLAHQHAAVAGAFQRALASQLASDTRALVSTSYGPPVQELAS